jgi:hypothetical protein
LAGANDVHRSGGSLQWVSVSMMLMPGKMGLTAGMGTTFRPGGGAQRRILRFFEFVL